MSILKKTVSVLLAAAVTVSGQSVNSALRRKNPVFWGVSQRLMKYVRRLSANLNRRSLQTAQQRQRCCASFSLM